jgi:hypothetical protein
LIFTNLQKHFSIILDLAYLALMVAIGNELAHNLKVVAVVKLVVHNKKNG